jgi:heme/copper-type cytochrome/quinol oxidase subunit 1
LDRDWQNQDHEVLAPDNKTNIVFLYSIIFILLFVFAVELHLVMKAQVAKKMKLDIIHCLHSSAEDENDEWIKD